jgi:hypothetical protein
MSNHAALSSRIRPPLKSRETQIGKRGLQGRAGGAEQSVWVAAAVILGAEIDIDPQLLTEFEAHRDVDDEAAARLEANMAFASHTFCKFEFCGKLQGSGALVPVLPSSLLLL